jgi:hypothetical protein
MAHVSPRMLNATLSNFKRVYLYDACILCIKIMKEEREVENTQRHAQLMCNKLYTILWATFRGSLQICERKCRVQGQKNKQ